MNSPHDRSSTTAASTAPRVTVDIADYQAVRDETEAIASRLTAEDQQIQSMPDVSPTKWHRAHITWFFETFLLVPHLPGYEPFDESFAYLYNSYYEAVGARHARDKRGLISRPTADEVTAYRAHVDDAMARLIADVVPGDEAVRDLVILGLHHEQQHQELALMDIKHVFWSNPFHPAYHPAPEPSPTVDPEMRWLDFDGGLVSIGHDAAADRGFHFDNEGPRHQVFLQPYRLADRLVTCGDWLDFMADDGYHTVGLWLSEGWARITAEGWEAPSYWEATGSGWHVQTLGGLVPVNRDEPVCHLSYYEADAFARWAGARLPTEAEWEHAAAGLPVEGNLAGTGRYHPDPVAVPHGDSPRQMFGDVWEWTSSSYGAYPGFVPAPGAVGEYNGKFMVNQYVLRGGCCATPQGHTRPTYRNFFPAHTRWMFSGLRLASDASMTNPPTERLAIDNHLEEGFFDRALRTDVQRGLASTPKDVPPKWFYDDVGSRLFEEITRLEEYYPTEAERSILRTYSPVIAANSKADTLVELGSGAADKTRVLLSAMAEAGLLERFVPFDVSEGILRRTSDDLLAEYPGMSIHGVVGDFEQHLHTIPRGGTRLIALLGGTIGNFPPDARGRFIADIAASMDTGDCFLLGTDLVKDIDRLELAYDDPQGVTAAFNKNVLSVMNRELGADFDLDQFAHDSYFDTTNEWIDIGLRSLTDQTVRIKDLDLTVQFAEGERMRTEISAKFRRDRVERELAAAGLRLAEWMTDERGDYALSLSIKD